MTVSVATTKIILQDDSATDDVFIESTVIKAALPINAVQHIVTEIAQRVNREHIVMIPSSEPSTDTVTINFTDSGSIPFVTYNMKNQLKEAAANHRLQEHNSLYREQMSTTTT